MGKIIWQPIEARWTNQCERCDAEIKAGASCFWNSESKKLRHPHCLGHDRVRNHRLRAGFGG